MTIPFLDLLKKLTGRFGSTVTEGPVAPVVPARSSKKPASERLSKTVLPHATRSFSAPDPFRSAAGVAAPRSGSSPSLQLGSQRITSAKKTQSSHLPPALARALEPKLERAISLCVGDFIEQIPAGYIKPVEILDAAARVSLKASEIEKGMPEKNPTMSLPSLYQQVPEIFIKGVRPDDDTRISLPYEKVLEQFQGAQVRSDQQRDPAVPQLDTPILKATIQDSERFGTKLEPIETSAIPPVPVAPATASTIAAAEPDAIVQHKAKPAESTHPIVSLYSPSLKPKSDSPTPPKIPFQLSPNGTGASASERVPASSGPPVPTPLPFTPELEPPAEKPKPPAKSVKTPPTVKFSDAPPAKEETKAAAPTLKLASLSSGKTDEKPAASKDEATIKLFLKPVFSNLPAFQLNGDIEAVPDDAQVALPLSLVEPQLASGRIAIAPDVFQNALPENYRKMFELDEAKTSVVLPLEEVLKNLPATVLKLRDDQEDTTLDKDFETPFSIKAKEDADRFGAEKKPAEKAAEPAKKQESAVQGKNEIAPAAAEKNVDPKEIITRANTLAGVKACAIMFSDGLSLAGELPSEIGAEGLCAMAPVILEKITQHVKQTKLGSLVAVTFHTTGSAVTFFAQGNICFAVLHSVESLPVETRKELAGLSEQLSKHYARTE